MDDASRNRRMRRKRKIPRAVPIEGLPESNQTKLRPMQKLRLAFQLTTQKNDMIKKLKSRKLWAAVLAASIVALGGQLGLDPETAKAIAATLSAYVIGQGIADLGAKGGSQGSDS